MTDRELLEAAAKAAGLTLLWHRNGSLWANSDASEPEALHAWNPLADDGDALRLAVKLGICVEFDYFEGDAPADPDAATRRAIVRAAAAMAKDKE